MKKRNPVNTIGEWFPNSKKNKRRGYFLAFKDSLGNVKVGWSLYNKLAEKAEGVKFDSYTAKALAYIRADAQLPDSKDIPVSMAKKFKEFIKRCERYFKTKVI